MNGPKKLLVFAVTAASLLVGPHFVQAQAPVVRKYVRDPSHLTSAYQLEERESGVLGVERRVSARPLDGFSISLIKDFEQWRPYAYEDASSFCTIGYGHLIAKQTCARSERLFPPYAQPLSLEAGASLLEEDTILARIAVQTLVTRQISDEQFGALVSFVFNVGVNNFRRSTLLAKINAGEFKLAPLEFRRYVKSRGKILTGLKYRRNCEAALFSGDIPLRRTKIFRRNECSYLGVDAESENLVDIEKGE